jgi:hypothetical protein
MFFKFLFYSKIVKSFEQQEYLNFNIPKELRNKLTKLRISAHSLAIETGRYSKKKQQKNTIFLIDKNLLVSIYTFVLKCQEGIFSHF